MLCACTLKKYACKCDYKASVGKTHLLFLSLQKRNDKVKWNENANDFFLLQSIVTFCFSNGLLFTSLHGLGNLKFSIYFFKFFIPVSWLLFVFVMKNLVAVKRNLSSSYTVVCVFQVLGPGEWLVWFSVFFFCIVRSVLVNEIRLVLSNWKGKNLCLCNVISFLFNFEGFPWIWIANPFVSCKNWNTLKSDSQWSKSNCIVCRLLGLWRILKRTG